jgi:hypothetical protein
MASSRLSRLALLLAALALGAAAQAPTRVRGTIAAFDGTTLSVKDMRIRVDDKTEIVFAKPVPSGDIRPGDFLAITSTKRPDGSLTAYEVRRFPEPVNPGHRPFDGRDDQTMTNATVGSMVQSANGRELTMTYQGGAQKIVLPEDASISTLVPGERAQLVPGAPVSLTMDANRVARRIQVGPRP